MDWSKIELKVYGAAIESKGLLALPKDNTLRELSLERRGSGWEVTKGRLPGVAYTITEG